MHAEDRRLFADTELTRLRRAVRDHSWLLGHGYPGRAALKLVGDRHALVERQRQAVSRCACADQALRRRRRRQLAAAELGGRTLHLAGYHVLATVQVALAGGLVLRGCDGCDRDLASMHGRHRTRTQTGPALEAIGRALAELGIAEVAWILDRPVPYSGKLVEHLLGAADSRGWNWKAELETNPDAVLSGSEHVVVSSDGAVLDACGSWFNLAGVVVGACANRVFLVDLSPTSGNPPAES
ncbi:MAG: DUF434 domain-containing protein [Candidatus Krumholzibacteriia bacterium]